MKFELLDEEQVLKLLLEKKEKKEYVPPEYELKIVDEVEEEEEKEEEPVQEENLEQTVRNFNPYNQEQSLDDKVKDLRNKEAESSQGHQSQYDVGGPQASVYSNSEVPNPHITDYWTPTQPNTEESKKHDPLERFQRPEDGKYHTNI